MSSEAKSQLLSKSRRNSMQATSNTQRSLVLGLPGYEKDDWYYRHHVTYRSCLRRDALFTRFPSVLFLAVSRSWVVFVSIFG